MPAEIVVDEAAAHHVWQAHFSPALASDSSKPLR
jgi:hypothetical protein